MLLIICWLGDILVCGDS